VQVETRRELLAFFSVSPIASRRLQEAPYQMQQLDLTQELMTFLLDVTNATAMAASAPMRAELHEYWRFLKVPRDGMRPLDSPGIAQSLT
jgi:hypothetical protein